MRIRVRVRVQVAALKMLLVFNNGGTYFVSAVNLHFADGPSGTWCFAACREIVSPQPIKSQIRRMRWKRESW